ncbi:hypothetical protein NECAME_03369 [Necator americanus]|uniref:SMB domain-containing protein n=1 Tax=Necator americanus TaxID=51031 RepID=W2T3W0_NECAM|nr:hypothetical protein NECAME_03369 [Necator americanus]ETN76700.1 hypothetical protein NECAME_03369 [Necator americanus]
MDQKQKKRKKTTNARIKARMWEGKWSLNTFLQAIGKIPENCLASLTPQAGDQLTFFGLNQNFYRSHGTFGDTRILSTESVLRSEPHRIMIEVVLSSLLMMLRFATHFPPMRNLPKWAWPGGASSARLRSGMGPDLTLLLVILGIDYGLPRGFHGIPGQYCAVRTPTCCENRNDECTAPILGDHLCYCDMFCDRGPDGGNDCCPDFEATCRGAAYQHADLNGQGVENNAFPMECALMKVKPSNRTVKHGLDASNSPKIWYSSEKPQKFVLKTTNSAKYAGYRAQPNTVAFSAPVRAKRSTSDLSWTAYRSVADIIGDYL